MLFDATFSSSAHEFRPSDSNQFTNLSQVKEFNPFVPSREASIHQFTPFQPSYDSHESPFIPS